MTVESEDDLIKLKRIGKIVALTFQEMERHLRPGITTAELDNIGPKGATPRMKMECQTIV